MTGRSKQWTLGQESFDRLLNLLAADREQAGLQYERIRQKLMKLFEWRGCNAPEEYADRTLDRVARTIEQGTTVRAENPYRYIYGTALNLLQEYRRDPMAGSISLSDETVPAVANGHITTPPEDDERRLQCLDSCLARVPASMRQHLLDYHRQQGRGRIAGRQQLSAKLGIPLNALRIRMYRLRVELEQCIASCMRNGAGARS